MTEGTRYSGLIDIYESDRPGFHSMAQFRSWRTAIINGDTEPRSFPPSTMQKHDLTDEVFVLLRGECVLIIADGDGVPSDIHFVSMQPLKLYNVKRSVWHACVRYPGCRVLVVENSDTASDNSPVIRLQDEQIEKIRLWLTTKCVKNLIY